MPPPPDGPGPGRRGLRIVLGVLAAIGLLLVFAVALVVSVVLHLDSGASRRAIAGLTTKLASSPFKGRIVIEDLRHASLRGLHVGRAVVEDPQGRPVLVLHDVRARFDGLAVARAFLPRSGRTPTVDAVVADRAEVILRPGPEGEPSLANAFEPRAPSTEPSQPSTFSFSLPSIDVRALRVDGDLAGKTVAADGEVASASVLVRPDETTIELPHVRLAAAPVEGATASTVRVELQGRAVFPSGEGALPRVEAVRLALDGAGLRAIAAGELAGETWSARVVVPETRPETLARAAGLATAPIASPFAAIVEAHGTFDEAFAEVDARLADGTASVSGRVDLAAFGKEPGPTPLALGEAKLVVRGLSARAITADAPALVASADATQKLSRTKSGLGASIAATGTPKLPGTPTAPFEIDTVASVSEDGLVDASGKIAAGLGRSRADVRFDLDRGKHLRASFSAKSPSLAELKPLVPVPLAGAAEASGHASLDLERQTIAVTAHGQGTQLAAEGVSVPKATFEVTAQGPIARPKFDAKVHAPEATVPGPGGEPQTITGVEVTAKGTPSAADVTAKLRTEAEQDVKIATRVSPTADGAKLTGTQIDLERDEFRGEVKVDDVTLKGGKVHVKGVRLASTAGGLRFEGRYEPGKRIDIRAKSTEVDLSELAFGLGLDRDDVSGKVSFDIDLRTLPEGRKPKPGPAPESTILKPWLGEDAPHLAKKPVSAPYVVGHVDLDLKDGRFGDLGPVVARIDVDVEGRLVEGEVAVAYGDVGRVAVDGVAVVPGSIDSPAAWRDAVGHVTVDAPEIRLGALAEQLGAKGVVDGLLAVSAKLARRDPKAPPIGTVSGETKGLVVALPSLRLDGVGLKLRASLAPTKTVEGEPALDAPLAADVSVEAFDANAGPFLVAHVGTQATWERIVEVPDPKDLPIVAQLVMAPRAIEQLPVAIARFLPFGGKIGMMARAEGTLAEPKFELRAKLDDMPIEGAPPHDATIVATYDGKVGRADVQITPGRRRRRAPAAPVAEIEAEVLVDAKDLLAKPAGSVPWTGRLDAKLAQLPLDLFAPFAEADLHGKVSGTLHVGELHAPHARAPEIEGRLVVEGLRIEDATFDEARARLTVDEGHATARLDVNGAGGEVHAELRVPLAWQQALVPSVPNRAPVRATLVAKGLRLEAFEPFVTPFDRLEGRLDAQIDAEVSRDVDAQGNVQWLGAPQGKATIREGIVVIDAIGERWEGVEADLEIAKGRIEVPRLSMGSPRGGRAEATGHAILEGFVPRTFHLELDARKFALASEGVDVGRMTGTTIVDGKLVGAGKERTLEVDVRLEKTSVDLAGQVGKAVQGLDDDPSIAIAHPLGPPVGPIAPGETMPVKITVHLGDVLVRRDDLRVVVRGEPRVEIVDQAKIFGEVRVEGNPASDLVQRSYVDVLGKRFYIQNAVVRFDGAPQVDPQIDASVVWQAADGTRVTITLEGPVSKPQIDYRSPGLSKGEIMNLLVFGRSSVGTAGQQRAAQQGAAAQGAALAQGVAGAVLGGQLQRALPTNFSVSLGAGRYAGAYQYKNVFFEIAYTAGGTRLGPQALGPTPRTTFSVEWRFSKSWALITTIGDTGSALVDLLWHYRY